MKLKERNDPGKYLYMKAAIKAIAEKGFTKYRLRHLSLNFLSFFFPAVAQIALHQQGSYC